MPHLIAHPLAKGKLLIAPIVTSGGLNRRAFVARPTVDIDASGWARNLSDLRRPRRSWVWCVVPLLALAGIAGHETQLVWDGAVEAELIATHDSHDCFFLGVVTEAVLRTAGGEVAVLSDQKRLIRDRRHRMWIPRFNEAAGMTGPLLIDADSVLV